MTEIPQGNVTQYETFENQTYFDRIAAQIADNLNIYYTPLLVLLGCFGNFISVYVFFDSKLRLQSTGQYLTALAVSDSIFLVQLLAPWLSAMQLTSIFFTGGFCQVFVYCSYVTCCLSAWLVMGFTVERFVAVLYPLYRNAWCTIRRARYIILLLSVGAALVNVPMVIYAIPTRDDCNIDNQYLEHAARFNLIDTIVSFTVPLSTIVFLNVWIVVGLYRLEKTRLEMLKIRQRTRPTQIIRNPPSQQHITRMLLIVSSVYVVLNLPAYAIRIIGYITNLGSAHLAGRWIALQQLALMFFHTNFGINFMLYCLSGQNFRRTVMQSIPWLRNRAFRQDAARRTTSGPARTSSISSISAASIVSNCIESPTNAPCLSPPNIRRMRPEPYIYRYTFDNRRFRRDNTNNQPSQSYQSRQSVEMIELHDITTKTTRV